MPKETNTTQNVYEKIKAGEFVEIVKWSVKLLFSLNRVYAIGFMAAGIVSNLVPLVDIYIISKILDKIVALVQGEGASLTDLYPYMLLLLSTKLLLNITGYFHTYFRRAININSRPKIRKKLYYKLHDLGVETLENPEINNKIQRANQSLYGIPNYFEQLSRVLSTTAELIATSILLLNFAPIVIPVIALIAIPRALNDKKYRRLVWKFGYENTEGSRQAYTTANNLTNAQTLKEILVNNALGFLDKKFTEFTDWYIAESLKLRKKWFLGGRIYSFLDDISIAAGYLIIFSKFLAVKITVGNVIFQLRIVDRFSRNLTRLSSDYNNLIEFSIRLKDIYQLFMTEPAIKDGKIKMPLLDEGPTIEVKDVAFSYPLSKKIVLDNLNLTINSGEKIAIVGHNGAGKTTLVKLICRMYQPQEGKIVINGSNLNDLEIYTWYQNIGVLFQDYNTYNQLTVKDNIIIGRPNKPTDLAKVKKSAKDADMLDFVENYEHGFDQILSEKYKGGIRPSTGQWQKIAISRFFYRDAPVVIFDEPTSAIDAVAEYNIFNKIYKFFQHKTVIIISHRFSTVRNADRIVVMEKGKIIEQGTHTELMNKEGYYARSFKLQAEGYSVK